MKIITARFIGEDGSLGFRNGVLYKLELDCNTEEYGDVSVQSIGVLNKNQGCIYDSVIKFLDNWTDIKTD